MPTLTGHLSTHRLSLAVVLSSLILLCQGVGAAEPAPLAPEKGRFLIATRNLHGTSFEKTVILLTEYNQQGAVGIAINRPTRIPLQEAIPTLDMEEEDADLKVFLGGPVHTDMVFILVRHARPGEDLVRIFDEVFMGAGLTLLKNTFGAEYRDTNPARSFFGYAGWAPGQLDAEIARGDWAVGDGDPDYIFTPDTDQIWGRLIRRWSGKWI